MDQIGTPSAMEESNDQTAIRTGSPECAIGEDWLHALGKISNGEPLDPSSINMITGTFILDSLIDRNRHCTGGAMQDER